MRQRAAVRISLGLLMTINVEVTGAMRQDGQFVRQIMGQGGCTAWLACRGASGRLACQASRFFSSTWMRLISGEPGRDFETVRKC